MMSFKITLFAYLNVCFSNQLLAAQGELAKNKIVNHANKFALPKCVNDAAQIEKILATERANPKSNHKYDGFKSAFESESDTNILARLIYSETLAANCPEAQVKIAPLIGGVIANRIKIRKGKARDVVFQRDQFASSFNNYQESRYRDLLCPQDQNLWTLAVQSASGNLKTPLTSDTVNYYLYKHSSRFKAPNWRLTEFPVNEPIQDCIRFFRNPSWI